VGVHGEGEAGGAAAVRQQAEDVAHLGVGGVAAAQLGRNAGGQEPMGAQLGEFVGHEAVAVVVGGGALGEARRQLAGDTGPVDPPRRSEGAV
jgi:hypothetical protein